VLNALDGYFQGVIRDQGDEGLQRSGAIALELMAKAHFALRTVSNITRDCVNESAETGETISRD
jgi:hypothetical protein